MLTVAEAAGELGVSSQTVYRMIRAGRLTEYPGRGRNTFLVDPEEIARVARRGPASIPAPREPLLTVSEVAGIFRCCEDNVRTMVANGRLAAFRLPGGRTRIRIPESAVNAFLARYSTTAASGDDVIAS